jgi:hypothetical protein
MPVVAASTSLPSAGAPTRSIVYSALAAIGFISGGLLVAALTLSTDLVTGFGAARPSTAQMAAGAATWAFALIVPGVFVIVGVARLVDAVELLSIRRQPARPATRLAPSLGEEHTVASRVRLPDGRIVPELVVGPFGVAVIEEVPPPSLSRHRGDHWELRVSKRRWVPIENPVERASRDAERVRGWLAHEDHDHVVKVYAAIIDPAGVLARTSACAVIQPDELGAWLAALPPQRSLYADRRTRVADLIARSVV